KPTTQYPSTPGFISNHWYGRWGQVKKPKLSLPCHNSPYGGEAAGSDTCSSSMSPIQSISCIEFNAIEAAAWNFANPRPARSGIAALAMGSAH
ncbi:hypothetical protein VDR55_21755, partial [Xanthomonas campestris pv. campestris]|nr:hypothetical protein [Xanthomonas campestris pv. campestris]